MWIFQHPIWCDLESCRDWYDISLDLQRTDQIWQWIFHRLVNLIWPSVFHGPIKFDIMIVYISFEYYLICFSLLKNTGNTQKAMNITIDVEHIEEGHTFLQAFSIFDNVVEFKTRMQTECNLLFVLFCILLNIRYLIR